MRYNAEVHHRQSSRLRGFDYTAYGAYFVTICTYGREMFLADRLVRGIVSSACYDLPRRFGFVALDQFVIMPNHVHGIIWITGATAVGAQHDTYSDDVAPTWRPLDADEASSKQRAAPLRQVAVARGSLGSVVRAFKSHSAKRINRLRKTPGAPVWQRNYWDRIVRNERELANIRQYIRDNPRRWSEDPIHRPTSVTAPCS